MPAASETFRKDPAGAMRPAAFRRGRARGFFKKARSKLREPVSDPAGTGKDLGAYLRGDALDEAVSKAESAFKRCQRAEEAAKNGDLAAMHGAYRRVFGDYYPY